MKGPATSATAAILPGEDEQHNENDSLSTSASTDSNSSDLLDTIHSRTPDSAMPSSPPRSPASARVIKGMAAVPPTTTRASLHPSPPTLVTSSPVVARRRRATMVPDRRHAPATPVRIALDMRTRSSRLFFVLLHLVGVSTIVPSGGGGGNRDGSSSTRGGSVYRSPSSLASLIRSHLPGFAWSSGGGIVGVHPTAILLSRLALESSRRGLKGILDRVERVWGWDADAYLLGEPYWFQDKADGRCLSPYGGGFGECGDATLWHIKRRPPTRRQARERRYKRRHGKRLEDERRASEGGRSWNERSGRQDSVCVWPFFCEQDSQFLQTAPYDKDEIFGFEYKNHDEDEEGFALQLMDVDAMTANSSFLSHRKRLNDSRRRRKRLLGFWNSINYQDNDYEDAECLLSIPSVDGESALQIGPCSSEAAWVWHVNRDGVLVRGLTKTEKRKRKRGRWRISPIRRASASASAAGAGGAGGGSGKLADFECVHRANFTSAILLPCDSAGDGKRQDETDKSLVGFSLVRYPSTASKIAPRMPVDSSNDAEPLWEPWTNLEGPSIKKDAAGTRETVKKDQQPSSTPEQHLPTSHTSSGNYASAGAKHPHHVDLKSSASMLHTSLQPGHGKAKKDATTSASHIRDAPVAMNGVSFHNQRMNKAGGEKVDGRPSMGPSSTKIKLKKAKDGRKNTRVKGQTPIHEEKGGPSEARGPDGHHHGIHNADSTPHPPRKIPVHPYIQSSKDFVWVDPLTSLEYPTDLCRYLGHTKKEAGRHTLMGVGQYYRTAFNIKVYGAALYVAKRDVLADPKFGEFATLSSEELRNRDDFYEHLMSMPSEEEGESSIGGFFDRTLFIKINMQLSTDAMRKSLEADWSLLTDEMKALIINSSFEERQADERMQRKIQSKENSSNCSCGQVAPSEFKADPTCCARGTELVFTWRKNSDFEIRLDGRIMDIFPRPDIARGIFAEYLNNNPISLDAKAHFADGFPFLLAPLAQVKGMSSAVPSHPAHESSKGKPKSPTHNNPMHRLVDAAVSSVGAVNTQAQTLSKWMQDSAVSASSSALGGAMGVARGLSEQLDRQRMEILENAAALQKEGMELLSHLIKQSAEVDGLNALSIMDPSMMASSPFSDGFDAYNEAVGLQSPPVIMPDEIGIQIEPNMNFTHRLFFTTVHVYLLLLLVLSLPGSSYTTRFVVVKRRILETKKFMEVQSQGALAAMSKLHH
mmetsp:Transcript_34871/g.74348  ORF Transcript_34871/g.74348 Transcript_34871/m.74348 type:complete len:1212 (+) Transcript_34871:333-3968(+)|eukprot:CAMPEP_0172555508 /NCGR_PEP_ID=MMETSP1067-20121228/58453_1 /TAXON_ID=265564 ORGANISM="Thalassiosira punctigera, Strain Tpunct2005C2" /NCGR_SAMPLE_ID=MMETSP1067 /ASSEMBLY_ACC=CAM_ASM_000444 /LENGTH=1211 /DNA_ID=CAMNT_0013344031 /DNA_START=303 /DNA_END=3938 /DNA_ORIENTATION=+